MGGLVLCNVTTDVCCGCTCSRNHGNYRISTPEIQPAIQRSPLPSEHSHGAMTAGSVGAGDSISILLWLDGKGPGSRRLIGAVLADALAPVADLLGLQPRRNILAEDGPPGKTDV